MLPGIGDWLDVDTALDAFRILIELWKLVRSRDAKSPTRPAQQPRRKRNGKRKPRRR